MVRKLESMLFDKQAHIVEHLMCAAFRMVTCGLYEQNLQDLEYLHTD
jgi:hypothetical protein